MNDILSYLEDHPTVSMWVNVVLWSLVAVLLICLALTFLKVVVWVVLLVALAGVLRNGYLDIKKENNDDASGGA